MTLDPALVKDMRDEVTLIAPGTRDVYGESTGGAQTTAQCRVSYRTNVMRDVSGRASPERGTVTLREPAGVTTGWEVVLPDGSTPRIIQVDRIPDETGWVLEVIRFGD